MLHVLLTNPYYDGMTQGVTPTISSKWRYFSWPPKKLEQSVFLLFSQGKFRKRIVRFLEQIQNDPLLKGAGFACAGIFAASLLLTFLTREEPSFRGKDRPVEHKSLGWTMCTLKLLQPTDRGWNMI